MTATTDSAPGSSDHAPPPVTPTPPEPPDGGSRPEAELDDRPHRSWLVRAAVVVLACSFLAAAIGYLVGVREQDTPSNAVDVGFLTDMSDHHDQAVTMGLSVYNRTTDPTIRSMAQEVIVFQRSDLGQMAAYLDDHHVARPDFDPERPAMQWMGMAMPAGRMTGMASDDQLAALDEATGRDLDLMFLDLMTVHHRGGVEMAEYAAEHAADPRVRQMAARIASQQGGEIGEYTQYRAQISP